MHGFPVTPNYTFPVTATYNMLDTIKDEVTRWYKYDWSGSYKDGDYTNLDAVHELFCRHASEFDDDDAYYERSDNPKDVSEWICRHKLVQYIDEIQAKSKASSVFDTKVEAHMRFLPHTSFSANDEGKQMWKSIGDIEMAAPMSDVEIDDDKVIWIAREIGADDFAETYKQYVENHTK